MSVATNFKGCKEADQQIDVRKGNKICKYKKDSSKI